MAKLAPATADQIWDTTKAYMNSNLIKKYDGILAPETAQGLGSFLTTNKNAKGLGISQDVKDDERLQKYNIIQMYPVKSKGEFENPNQVYIITDEKGFDIGIYDATENRFELSDKIKDANKEIISRFPEASQTLLKERYKVENLKDLSEKLSKGEELVLASEEQAQDDIEEEYEKQGLSVGDGTTNQDPEEKEAIESLPADMRADIVEQCRARNIAIKSVLVVDDPKSVATEIGDEDNHIRQNGGPVVIVQARSGNIDSAEDVYMFQDGQDVPETESHKDRLNELMYQNKNSGYVTDLEDNREDEILIALDKALLEYQNRMQMAEAMQEGEDKDKAISFARETLRNDTYKAIAGYVPDRDGAVAQKVEQNEYEATPDRMEEIDEFEKDVIDGMGTVVGAVGTAALAATGLDKSNDEKEEDGGRSRWDLPDPYNH